MKLSSLLEKIDLHWKEELPFVLYALPGENTVHLLLQQDAILHNTKKFDAPAFVFAPFQYKDTSFCIPELTALKITTEVKLPPASNTRMPIYLDDISDKEKHLLYVSEILKQIENGTVTKVVASRKKEVSLQSFNLNTLISRIIAMDVAAFRYIWFHPKTGIWCGATPEVLFLSKGETFSTMALAGTQKVIGNLPPTWGPKEYFEQQLVTDAIANSLEDITSSIEISKPKTHRAGSLYHIKTQIQGVLKNECATLPKIASVLHPTPAVCGTPRKEAFKAIAKYEGYDREFYTGFMGPIHQENNTSQLFVNLRCMKINPTGATIYVGGGITLDSVPEDEWEETKNKTATMLGVLGPMLS
jgi:isochorismate synthase